MKYKIYIVGKIKEKYYKEAIKEYSKRLSRYCKIELIERKNIDYIKKDLTDKTHVILINTSGNQLTSVELSNKINTLAVGGKSDISIIYTNEKIDYNEHISIAGIEMNESLAITLIYEQIYRGYRILNNEPYHK